MGEHQRRRRRRRGSGEDRISGLPDALLHEILVRLRSADAAARTSVLSRRWRHVWAHLPELRLVAPREAAPASFIDTVDAALGGYLAPTLEHLGVSHRTDQQGIPAGRIAPWLHFAAEHVVGELNLFLRVPLTFGASTPEVVGEEAVLKLPVCEQAKRIQLFLQYAYTMWLRPQASGLFTALTSLKIDGYVRMEGSDLTALVSTQCPCLRDLDLFIKLIVIFDVFIHSNSLHTLVLCVFEARWLEVVAPRLEELTIFIRPLESHISAPKLVKVTWHDAYDPDLHRFVDAGRTLRLLKTSSRALSLTMWFDEVDELDLSIYLKYRDTHWLRPQASGLFRALTFLKINGYVHMNGSDLTAFVSTQCPCLRDLDLSIKLIVIFDVFIHSNSLHTLVLHVVETRRLEVLAPKLEEITVIIQPIEAHISAPKLVKVAWYRDYDPHLHRFVDVGRTFRLLETSYGALFLTKRFDEVDELDLSIFIPQGVEGYGSFLNEMNKLPKCKSFRIDLTWDHHALVPSMSHLLKRCNGAKKISIKLFGSRNQPLLDSCPQSCPCGLEESHKIDSSTLSSLEEVEISDFTDSLEDMELVEFLSSNAVILKRLVINYMMFPDRPITKEVCEKIRSMCHRTVKVEFHVFRDAKLVPFD